MVGGAAAPRASARPDGLLGLSVEAAAGRPRRRAARLDQPPPGAPPAAPRPDPALVGSARGRRALRRHLAPDGRRARHRRDPRPDVDPDRGRGCPDRGHRAEARCGGVRSPPRRARAGRGRRSRRSAGEGRRELGRSLRGRRLRARRLVTAGPEGPRPGTGLEPDDGNEQARRSGRGARWRAPPARPNEPARSRRRLAPRGVRRRPDLARRDGAAACGSREPEADRSRLPCRLLSSLPLSRRRRRS